jgi:hypothetical protein
MNPVHPEYEAGVLIPGIRRSVPCSQTPSFYIHSSSQAEKRIQVNCAANTSGIKYGKNQTLFITVCWNNLAISRWLFQRLPTAHNSTQRSTAWDNTISNRTMVQHKSLPPHKPPTPTPPPRRFPCSERHKTLVKRVWLCRWLRAAIKGSGLGLKLTRRANHCLELTSTLNAECTRISFSTPAKSKQLQAYVFILLFTTSYKLIKLSSISARSGNLEVPVYFLKAKQGYTVRK